MKKTLLFTAFIMGMVVLSNAQAKTYQTKNAIVHFIAEDDNDIDAVNKNAVSRIEPGGKLSFILLIKDFHFEMDKMQDHFNTEYMESDKFPRAFFNGQIANFDKIDFKKDGKYPIVATGNMQVHGVNKQVTANGFMEIKNGIPTASAKITVTLKDFGIGGILIKMVADKINVDITATYP
jgi:hypothetical protein